MLNTKVIKNDVLIEYNNSKVFLSEVVVGITMHNSASTIHTALSSILKQESSRSIAAFLVNDMSDDQWEEKLGKFAVSDHLVVAHTRVGSTTNARNFIIDQVKEIFPNYQWLGRLDSDDELYDKHSVEKTLSTGLKNNPNAKWILAGNVQRNHRKLLPRKNLPDTSLLTKEGLLQRLDGMARDDLSSELPSCNLWLHREMKSYYPNVPSAEDHWHVAYLLATKKDQGAICEDVIYSIYSLNGTTTNHNRRLKTYLSSRRMLHRSLKALLDNKVATTHENIILGWGKEGIIIKRGDRVHKRFYPMIIDDNHGAWLKQNLKNPHFPEAEWQKDKDSWEAIYPFEKITPLKKVHRMTLRRFIHHCLDDNLVFLDFARYNLRLKNGEIHCIDIGRDIQPFNISYFRDMCARAYLTLVQGWSDMKLKRHTKIFQDDEDGLKSLDGFEDFYREEMESWFNSQGFSSSPDMLDGQPNKEYPDVSLLIKACTMDAWTLDVQIPHILSQLCSNHTFAENILLIDPKEKGFLREHNKGDLQQTISKATHMKDKGILDKVIVSPNDNETNTIEDTLREWFDIQCKNTHTNDRVPVFPQLWAFDQIKTRYVLQLDVDSIIGRRDLCHDFMDDMLKAISKPRVFSVGFNIFLPPGSISKPYDAPDGGYVPEVRFGLLDLTRIKKERPLPNSISNGKLDLTWYRALEKHQIKKGWMSLRGGDPRSYYIHPPNTYKKGQEFLLKVIDLVEQDNLPGVQKGNCDLMGSHMDWSYHSRNEEMMVVVLGRNPERMRAQRCLESLFSQTYTGWGSVIIDDASDPSFQRWLRGYIKDHRERITLVQRKKRFGKISNLKYAISDICTNPDTHVVILDMDDSFMHSSVLERLYNEVVEGADIILGGMYRPDKPLKRYEPRFDDVRKPDGGNVWIHLKSFRKGLFDKIPEDRFTIDGELISYCEDFATMIPMVEMAKKCVMIHEYLYYHERSTPNNPKIRKQKDIEIEHIVSAPPFRRELP